MKHKRMRITIIGAGRLGSALARALHKAGYEIHEIVTRADVIGTKVRAFAKSIGAQTVSFHKATFDADLIWLCVPDREIANVAASIASRTNWRKKVAFHSSGALSSEELNVLRELGARVAAVHPFMTFIADTAPALHGVPFALEGDAAARRKAQLIVRDLGGNPFLISKNHKPAYHAWGSLVSPMLVALLAAAEAAAIEAGQPAKIARARMLPMVKQTIANYEALGPAGAFTGPIARGDAAVVRKHLNALKKQPDIAEVYRALALTALKRLPLKNEKDLRKALSLRGKTK
jgi:predicted short-subunit dehydrogenase-like oxidoreductase (DUF2520 family)